MAQIKVFTDSTCDLSPEIIAQHEIGVVPVYVTFDDQTYRDGVDMTVADLYKKVEECGKLPKTAAPSPGDFIKAFRPYIDAGQDIIYVGLSTELSSTCHNAILAAEEFPEGRIVVVDSLNLSTGIGLSVLKAVDYAQEGLSVKEVAERVMVHIPKVETEFVIDTLDYLYKGGRCSAMQNLIGSMLKLRPLIKVVNGKMIVGDKSRGKKERALELLLERALRFKDTMDLSRVFVTYSLGAEEDAQFVKGELEKLTEAKEVIVTQAGCVISSHCGPGTVGILFITQ